MKDFLELRIKEIIPETADAATYLLENISGQPVHYQAGQFLTLLLEHNGRELRRSYSLSSAPEIDPDLAITIKRVTNGEVSRYLLDTLKAGDVIRSLYPAGRFTLQTDARYQRDIFLFGAGSGLTPLYSILKTILRQEPQSRVILINSNKNPRNALFWQPVNNLAVQFPQQFKCIHLFSDPAPGSGQYPVRLNISLVQQLVNENLSFDRNQAQFFVCGPPFYMRMVRMALIFMEFREEVIHREHFVTEPLKIAQPQPTQAATAKPVQLIYRHQTYTIEVPPGQFILKAALNNGIQLPYSCQGGLCSTCAGKCKQGKVKMMINEVLTDREVAEGWVLTCVAYPLSEDVIIEIPSV